MIRCLIFDLDDTLLDTWNLLIPEAARHLCRSLIAAGVATTVEDCVKERDRFLRENPRGNVYEHLVRSFQHSGANEADLARIGYEAYHSLPIPPDLKLIDGVQEMLTALSDKYALHLVTAGDHETQKQKIKVLNLEPLVDRVWIVDPHQGQSKADAFREILKLQGCKPSEALSIGNRLDLEIKLAKQLGCQTCYIEYGEHVLLKPADPHEVPDYHLKHITDLVRVCRL